MKTSRLLAGFALVGVAACSGVDEAPTAPPNAPSMGQTPSAPVDSVTVVGWTMIDNQFYATVSGVSYGSLISPCQTMTSANGAPIGTLGCRWDSVGLASPGDTLAIGGTVDVWAVQGDGSNTHVHHMDANFDRFVVHFSDPGLEVRFGAFENFFPDDSVTCSFEGWNDHAGTAPYLSTDPVIFHTSGSGHVEYWAHFSCSSSGSGGGGDGSGGHDPCIICGD